MSPICFRLWMDLYKKKKQKKNIKYIKLQTQKINLPGSPYTSEVLAIKIFALTLLANPEIIIKNLKL